VQQLHEARQQARDRGMLWRLSRDGRESWLYGTLHVGRLEWAFAGPALRRALSRSDVLAIELDVDDAQVARQLAAALYARGDGPPLPAGLRQRLQRQLDAACGAAKLRGLPPPLQAIGLTLLAARQDAIDAAYGQERMLAALARAEGRRVVSLESVERQLDLLLPRDPALARRMLDGALSMLEDERVRPMLRRLAAAWAAGDLATIESYAQWCHCANDASERALLKRLNDERNPALAESIDDLHQRGDRVFAAVGALHMTGPLALPRLMAQRGYRVERIDF
jgi:uncharacterized protein YbaP (TraB family)